MPMDKFFAVENLNYHYQKHVVLHNLNLQINAGECVALLGPSGIGKSTLLRIIAGLVAPTSGNIVLKSRQLTRDGQHLIPCEKRKIGMVFQDYALFPQLTVYENIAFGLRQRKFAESAIEKLVKQLLSIMNMPALGDRYPRELSGGQQQRVALARALVVQPELLLLDEPFANIDTTVRIQLHAELQRIITEQQLSVLLVTHDRHEAFSLAQRVGILVPTESGAQLAQFDQPEIVYMQPKNITVAQLTGAVNLFSGFLRDKIIETGLGSLTCAFAGEGAGIVVLRPESLEFSPTTSGQARVVSKQFYGAGYRLVVDTPVGLLLVNAPFALHYQIGDVGNLTLKQDAWFISSV
jgi:ABC-type Fe3+/spermidine/putrescine transport system ATPase subunit